MSDPIVPRHVRQRGRVGRWEGLDPFDAPTHSDGDLSGEVAPGPAIRRTGLLRAMPSPFTPKEYDHRPSTSPGTPVQQTTASRSATPSSMAQSTASVDLNNTPRNATPSSATRSTASNNPDGCVSLAQRKESLSEGSLQQALCWRCDSATCPGLQPETSQFGQMQMATDIKAIRLKFSGKGAAGETISQAVLDTLHSLTPCGEKQVPVPHMKWRVGTRDVCHWCWAMAAGLVTQGSKIAKKQSFTTAVTAYRNGFVIMPVRHKDAKESKSSVAKLPSAIAWISEHAKPGEGHTQQVATDDSMHFQGESRKQLWRRMNGDLGERLVQRGQKVAMREGKPEVCSYQWFLKAVITLNKNRGLSRTCTCCV